MSDSSGGSCCAVTRRHLVIGILLVLLGVATTGWVVTATRKPPAEMETVEVLVAAKDVPVGTMITLDDLKGHTMVKVKKVPKAELPPAFVADRLDLVDKRLTRPIRAEGFFNPEDLSKGGYITLPEGYDLLSVRVGVGQGEAGFIGPGSRVNILATVRKDNTLHTFPLLVNVLVINVDSQVTYDSKGAFPSTNLMGFAVTEEQVFLLELAKRRECQLDIVTHKPNKVNADGRDIDKIFKFHNDLPEIAPPPRPVKQ
jgi:pilus assembly protein CpaB